MRVLKIEATPEHIILSLDNANTGQAIVRESAPIISEKPGRVFSIAEYKIEDNAIRLNRFDGAHDRLFSEFSVISDNKRVEGIRYVTDIADDIPANRGPYPQPDTIMALGGSREDMMLFGSKQGVMNINLPAIMTAMPRDGYIPFDHCGRTYWFIRDKIDEIDNHMQELNELDLTVTFILLNSPKHFEPTGEKALLDACLHPRFDAAYHDAFISAFDMRTEEGQGYYRAFCEFLVRRYASGDSRFARLAGFIVSNEVDSQYVWGNAGEMNAEDYVLEYTQALRLAWLCGRKHCSYFRVYISVDHLWTVSHIPTQPLRYYTVRKVLDCLNRYSVRDGNFPWNVAHHPYPEDLNWPDFWHDRHANFTFNTPKITFKNMEVLPAYLAQSHMLYRGEKRRIIFSEQGFNSQCGTLADITEKMGEAGFVLAYLKARNIDTVDLFTHNGYVDNPHEFGLNLGIRRYDPTKPRNIGEPKPIYYAVCDLETEKEAERVTKAREYIGAELFDYLLNPPEVTEGTDPNMPSDFGN